MLHVAHSVAKSDTGRQRHTNEDSYYARAPVFAVADGMGGASGGEVAARMATEAVAAVEANSKDIEQALKEAASRANAEIWSYASQDPSRVGMGTTLTMLVVGTDDVSIAHVGDSRAYILRDGKLRLLTQDHSLVEELRRQGTISQEEAESHPQRSIITRALGPAPEVEIDSFTHAARDGDTYLLCSDGLTTMVPNARIEEIMRDSRTVDDAAAALVSEANSNGGRDNITVVLVRIGDLDAGDGDEQHTMAGVVSPLAQEGPVEKPEGDGGTDEREQVDETMVVDAENADRARREVAAPPKAKRRRSKRALFIALTVVAVLAITTTGAVFGVRQVYFIGTDKNSLLTVYRGLPYELPGGIHLYSSQFVSAVPAGKLKPYRRSRLLDHKLRSKDDALGLLRELERNGP